LTLRHSDYIIKFLSKKRKRGEFMQVRMLDMKVDEMNLYDYVLGTFEIICDLTDGRLLSLNYFLNNVNARFVNVAEFKAVFEVTSFEDIMRILTDEDSFDVLHEYGVMCEAEIEKEKNSIVPCGKELKKVPIQQ
jgi:predicted CopG family antitoxin